jgi:hypothetical protein
MRDRFEAGDSVQFTFVSSIAPDSVPSFAVFSVNSEGLLVNSQTAQQSATTAFYAMFTMPQSEDGAYLGEWTAFKTVAGTSYPFRKRFDFEVIRTKGAL